MKSYLNSSRSNLEPFVRPFGLEIGLPVEEIYIRWNEDKGSAKIIEAVRGDVEIDPVAMMNALSEIPNACKLDVDQLASDWLGQVRNLLVFANGRCGLTKQSALSMALIPGACCHDLVLPPRERFYFENQTTSFITASHMSRCLIFMGSKIIGISFLYKQA